MTIETAAPEASPALSEIAAGFGLARVVLKPRKAKPFFGRHPWVLDTAIQRVEGSPADGDVVDLVTDKLKLVARGLYNSKSRIRVRLYTWAASQLLDEPFWRRQLSAALRLRRQCGYDSPAGACRLVYSEADGVSGLIVDRYAEHMVVQVNSLAVSTRLESFVRLLAEMCQPRSISARSEKGMVASEGLPPSDGLKWGQPADGPVFIEEHGIRYGVDLATGQKTGFYLDQRENRRAAAAYQGGRRVLDVFCYSGGFSLAASRLGGASEVLAIDSSEKALVLAQANAELNGVANISFRQADGFEALSALRDAGQRFGAVVLDPPKFTRSRQTVDDALRAYHRLNRLGADLLEPEGIFVTCSCSGSVTREDMTYLLSGVSQQTGRGIQILEQRGAAPDHPVSATCLESEYLKCFICRVA